jgi:hypothetical protein
MKLPRKPCINRVIRPWHIAIAVFNITKICSDKLILNYFPTTPFRRYLSYNLLMVAVFITDDGAIFWEKQLD